MTVSNSGKNGDIVQLIEQSDPTSRMRQFPVVSSLVPFKLDASQRRKLHPTTDLLKNEDASVFLP